MNENGVCDIVVMCRVLVIMFDDINSMIVVVNCMSFIFVFFNCLLKGLCDFM